MRLFSSSHLCTGHRTSLCRTLSQCLSLPRSDAGVRAVQSGAVRTRQHRLGGASAAAAHGARAVRGVLAGYQHGRHGCTGALLTSYAPALMHVCTWFMNVQYSPCRVVGMHLAAIMHAEPYVGTSAAMRYDSSACLQAEVPWELNSDHEVSALGVGNVIAGLFAGGGPGWPLLTSSRTSAHCCYPLWVTCPIFITILGLTISTSTELSWAVFSDLNRTEHSSQSP